jgi:hypothetical protein
MPDFGPGIEVGLSYPVVHQLGHSAVCIFFNIVGRSVAVMVDA